MHQKALMLLLIAGIVTFPNASLGHPPQAREQGGDDNRTPIAIALQSGGLVPPLVIPARGRKSPISRVAIKGKTAAEGPGGGSITFDVGPQRINEFGDIEAEGGREAEEIPITFRRSKVADEKMLGAVLLEIIPEDKGLLRTFYLVLYPKPAKGHQLLIVPPGTDVEVRARSERFLPLLARLELQGKPDVTDPTENQKPLKERWSLSGLQKSVYPHLSFITLDRGEGGLVQFNADPNSPLFGPFGNVIGTTAVWQPPRSAKLQPRDIPDPLRQKRTLWDVVVIPRKPTFPGAPAPAPESVDRFQYRLVLSPLASGPHRLLILDDSEIVSVVPLR